MKFLPLFARKASAACLAGRLLSSACLFAVVALLSCAPRAMPPSGSAPTPRPEVAPSGTVPTREPLSVTPASAAVPAGGASVFTATVRPILVAHCAPCHEPGGKMYERLPFDRAETIASHREGVLRRLKGDDRAAVERWLDAQERAAGAGTR